MGSSFFSKEAVDEPKLNPILAVGLLPFTSSPVAVPLGAVDPKLKAPRTALLPASLLVSAVLEFGAPNVNLVTSGLFSSLLVVVELDAPNVKLVTLGFAASSLLFLESLEAGAVPKEKDATAGLLSSPIFASEVKGALKANPSSVDLLVSSFFEPTAPNVKPEDGATGAGEGTAPNVKALEAPADCVAAAPNENSPVIGTLVVVSAAGVTVLPNEKEGLAEDDNSVSTFPISETFSFPDSPDSFGVSHAGHFDKFLSY